MGELGSIVWLCAQEEKETEFGKHMVVSVPGCVDARFTGYEDPVETSLVNEHLSVFAKQDPTRKL